jgi:hypothetical protein
MKENRTRNPKYLPPTNGRTSFDVLSIRNAFETRKSIQDDFGSIDASLKFINDLLRNMLGNQLHIELAHTDLHRDVLEQLASMMCIAARYLRSCWTAAQELDL